MLRRVGLAISYVIAVVYIFSILLPAFYCWSQGCRGPGELDAFMPAFLLTPLGAIGTAFALNNTVQNIRKKQSAWLFWPLTVIFSTVLLGVVGVIGAVVYHTAFRR